MLPSPPGLISQTITVNRGYVKALSEYDPAGETLLAQLPALRHTRLDEAISDRPPLGWESIEEANRAVVYRAGFFRSELTLE